MELLISETDRAASFEAARNALQGTTWNGDLVVRRRDGTSFLARFRLFPVRGDDGNVAGLLGFAHDTTEAHASQQLAAERASVLEAEDDAVPAIVAVVRPTADETVETLYTNEAWDSLFAGRSKSAPPIYHTEDIAPEDLAQIRALVLSGQTAARDVRIRDPQGVYRWFRIRLIPNSADAHAVSVVTIVGIDIDGQRQAAAAAEQRSAVLRRLADAVPALLTVSVPAEGVGSSIIFMNRRWQEYTGLSAEDLADEATRRTIYHPDDRDRIPTIMRQAASTERVDGNIRFRRADGTYRWHRVVHDPVTDPSSDSVVAYVTVGLDVHETYESEQVRARLAAIVDGSADAIVGKSLDGIITSWNAAAQRLYGFTADEVVGQSVDIYTPEERRDEIHDLYRRLGEGESFPPFETERMAKDGRRIPVSLTVSPVVDQGGRVTGAAAIARDITEEKRMVDALRRANAIKEEFLSLVSHELRTPLTTVVGLAHVLARRADRYDEETQEIHVDLFREGGRLQAIIENMLMLTRLDHEPVGLDPVSAERLITRVATRFQERRPSCPLETDIAPGLPPVAGQEGWLEQILENLLSNAEKYSPGGGLIVLSAAQDGETVVMRVRDHGPGIADEDRPHIFEAFFRARATSGVPGAGLGLAVCQRLAELQDGQIVALAAEGGGTVMELRLKAASGNLE